MPELLTRPAVSFAPRASGATGASALLAGAGLGQRQTNRIAQLYGDDLDKEDDDAASGFPQAAQEDDPLSQLLQGAGSVDAQTLASLEMIRLIREMRDEERRRRADYVTILTSSAGAAGPRPPWARRLRA